MRWRRRELPWGFHQSEARMLKWATSEGSREPGVEVEWARGRTWLGREIELEGRRKERMVVGGRRGGMVRCGG